MNIMKSTFYALTKLGNENEKLANEKYLELYNCFSNIGVDGLIKIIKDSIKYASVPNWAKDCFINSKQYKLEIDEDGFIRSIEINGKFEDKTCDEHYYIYSTIAPTLLIIRGGRHHSDMTTLIQFDDMEDLLNIKLFD